MFKRKHKYFGDLAPTERIPKIIEEYIYPDLEKVGFKLLKSRLSIKRDKNGFVQEIWFTKSKWNISNSICEIEPHFTVNAKNYGRWHKKQYQQDLKSNIVLSNSAYYIKDWDLKSLDGHKYDFAKHDNGKLVSLILNNILGPGLKYLDSLSDVNKLTDFLMADKRYFKAPMMIDLNLMRDDIEKAKLISNWFWDYKNSSDVDFMETTLADMKIRTDILKNMA